MKSHVFVTGGTGFLGSHVVERLLARGEAVCCLVRDPEQLRWLAGIPVTFVQGTLFDSEALKAGLSSAEYVVHVAGVTRVIKNRSYFRENVEATAELLEAVARRKAAVSRFVHVSSQAAVGPSRLNAPAREDDPPAPVSDYGRSKLESERLAKEFMNRFPITIVRPCAIYGPRDLETLRLFRAARSGIALYPRSQRARVSLIHVRDAAEAIVAAARHQRAPGETYHIANPESVSWRTLTGLLSRLMDRRIRMFPLHRPLAMGIARLAEGWAAVRGKPTMLNRDKAMELFAGDWALSSEKIRLQLGFSPSIPLETGLREALAWYREEGLL